MKQGGQIWTFVVAWAFMMVLLAFFIQMRDYYEGGNPIVRRALAQKEGFQGAAGRVPEVEGVSEHTEERGLSPGAAGLSNMREPYTLLNDWFKPKLPEDSAASGSSPPGRREEIPDGRYGEAVKDLYKEIKTLPRRTFNSQTCYETDFQARLEKTGNYRQLTNNYKRGDPDSCSAPLQDTAMGFYKVDAVPAAL